MWKIEFSLPDLEGRASILRIHAKSMSVERDIRWELISRLCPNATGAELRSVATEAGMFAIRARRKVATEKDFLQSVEKGQWPHVCATWVLLTCRSDQEQLEIQLDGSICAIQLRRHVWVWTGPCRGQLARRLGTSHASRRNAMAVKQRAYSRQVHYRFAV
jgi:SpoVK/Ycf46/Vps4 family AAA+-type ATPase